MFRILACGLALFLLTGCSSLWNRSYVVQTDHISQKKEENLPKTVSVQSREVLREALVRMAADGIEHREFVANNYQGVFNDDFREILADLREKEPLYLYAVSVAPITQMSNVLAQNAASISVDLVYKKDIVKDIVSVSNREQLTRAIAAGWGSPKLAFDIRYYNQTEMPLKTILHDAFLDAPEAAVPLPASTAKFFPEFGTHRILELTFDYDVDLDTLETRRLALTEAMCSVSPLPSPAPSATTPPSVERNMYQEIYTWGISREEGKTDESPSAYSFLVEGDLSPQAVAMGFSLVCAEKGLRAEVVEAKKSKKKTFFNKIHLGETLFYANLSVLPSNSTDAWFQTKEVWEAQGFVFTAVAHETKDLQK